MSVSYGSIKSCLLRKTYFNSYFQHKSEKKNGDFYSQKALMVKGILYKQPCQSYKKLALIPELCCPSMESLYRVSRGKTGEGGTGKRIIGTAQGQGVYRRGRLHTGVFATPIGRHGHCQPTLHESVSYSRGENVHIPHGSAARACLLASPYASNNAWASWRSAVSKPSVNQP
jgi:hypothetical protein